jgi:hypothetical protein
MTANVLALSAALRQLEVDRLWQRGLTGHGVGIGHLDSGVDPHPALEGRIGGFMQFDDGGNPVPGRSPFDSGQHGTHTAGLICGGVVDGVAIGAAPQGSLYCGVVIDGGQTILRILRGLCWLAKQPVRVASLPLGIPAYNPVFREAIAALRQRGVLPITAIGNRGAGRFHSPGAYPEVLAVGAVNGEGQVASFSGSLNVPQTLSALKPDVLAPGKRIVSLHPDGQVHALSGTSMSSACVAGLAALLFEACPCASVASVEAALIHSSIPVDAAQSHRCRAGVVNAPAALEHLLSCQPSSEDIAQADYAAAVGSDTDCFIDPHLRQQFFYRGESSVLPAIVGVTGTFADVMLEINDQVGEEPAALESLLPTRLVLVHASVRWLKALLVHSEVTLASDVDVDIATVLFG